MRKGLIFLTLVLLLVTTVQAVSLEKGTILAPASNTNVTYIMGHNYTFDLVIVRNDSIQLNNTNFSLLPQPITAYVNLTLYNLTDTLVIWNVTAQNINNTILNASFEYGGTGAVALSSIFYNESLVKYDATSTRTGLFALDTLNQAELELGYANFLYADFYDERTGQQLSGNSNISLEIWGDDYAAKYNFTGNNKSFDRLPVGEYELRYWAKGYPVRSYYVSPTANSNQTVKLYMLNDTYANLILYTITDTSALPAEDMTIKVLRKMIPSNAWEVVEMAKSDVNGEGSFGGLEMYDVPYRFIIERNNTQYKYTDPSRVSRTELFFKNIDLLGESIDSFWKTRDVGSSLVWNNDTHTFEYTFSDASGFVLEGWLEVNRKTNFIDETICNETVTAATATLECNLTSYLAQSGTYKATGWVHTNSTNSPYITETLAHTFWDGQNVHWGTAGIFYGMIFILILALIGVWNPAVSMMMAIFGLIVSTLLGLWPIGIDILIGISIMVFVALRKERI